MPPYKIFLFETKTHRPVREFILSLNASSQLKAMRLFDVLAENGPMIGMPYVKKITADIYELRVRGRKK